MITFSRFYLVISYQSSTHSAFDNELMKTKALKLFFLIAFDKFLER